MRKITWENDSILYFYTITCILGLKIEKLLKTTAQLKTEKHHVL